MRGMYLAILAVLLAGGGWFIMNHPAVAPDISALTASSTSAATSSGVTQLLHNSLTASSSIATTSVKTPRQLALSAADLLALADNAYADGNLPLGDYKYVTSAPKKGSIYLCNVHKDNPGSQVTGPWMHGETWNYLQKVSVAGSVSWPNAAFANTISGSLRILQGNGLPVGYSTGVFPVAASDPAHAYDPNPNTISSQSIKQQLPANPVYSATPYCMGGEVGIMTDGVPLFNGFDAGLRDAVAHELQDSCDGHPQGSGEYHYHSLSACFKDINETTVLGYAYDGFPITGPLVAAGKYLTTDVLDECHGITSEIIVDGKKKVTYHYVMTRDFPYSASCFRGKPVGTGPGGSSVQSPSQGTQAQSNTNTSNPPQGSPPQEALAACTSKSSGTPCSFTSSQGTISGTCGAPSGKPLACHP